MKRKGVPNKKFNNHDHFLFRSGTGPFSRLMRPPLTGYGLDYFGEKPEGVFFGNLKL